MLEYDGTLLSEDEAKDLEKQYEKDGKGSFMFYFNHGRRKMW